MGTDSDDLPKASVTLKVADRAPAENIEASIEFSQLEQHSSFWDALQASFAQALTSSQVEQSDGPRESNILGLPERQSLGERFAPSSGANIGRRYGGEFQRLIEKAGAKLMQLTPLERMNRRYPNMKLHSLPEMFPLRDLLGEPDVDVCLQYYQRFMAASESEGDEPVSILLEFLKEHPIEFGCSGWTWYAVGYIVLGYPTPGHCERRARKLFSSYWRDTNSPKHKKLVQQSYRMFKACQKLNSPHGAHLRAVVKWMDRAADRGLPGTTWFDEYTASRPNRCDCLNECNFQLLRKAYVKIARRYEESPAASTVVLEAVAAEHQVSSRALAEFRADAKKRTRNSQ
jgi:hypothetical protein